MSSAIERALEGSFALTLELTLAVTFRATFELAARVDRDAGEAVDVEAVVAGDRREEEVAATAPR